MSTIVIAIAAFVGVFALIFGVATFFRNDNGSKLEDRLHLLATQGSSKQQRDDATNSVLNQPLDNVPSFFAGLLARLGSLSKIFEQADTSLTPEKFFLITGLLFAGGAGFGVLNRWSVALAVLVGLTTSSLPVMWLMFRRKRRMAAFQRQLPEALELMGRALRSGHSLSAGFELVSQEVAAPLGTEFGRVYEEQNLGVPFEEALTSLTERMPNLDLKFFSTAVILQRTTGGDLAEILDKIGHLIRERFRIFGQVAALTGEGRLSGIVLLALPPVLFLVVYRLNPSYSSLLFEDELGKKMLIGAVIMQLLGALVIRKIVNIKV